MTGTDLCSFCDEPVELTPRSGNYMLVKGWAKLRPRGMNEVKMAEQLGEYMHRGCMTLFKAGVSKDQESLF